MQRTARNQQSSLIREKHAQQEQKQARDLQRLAAFHKAQLQEIENQLKVLDAKKRSDEQKFKAHCQERDKRQWNRIESVIKFEEDKVKAKLEAERKAKEEEERRKQAEEEQKRLEAEKQKLEELQKRLQKEKEEQEQRQRDQEQKEALEKEKSEASGRSELGFSTASEDWTQARNVLKVGKLATKNHVADRSTAFEIWPTQNCESGQEP